MKNNFLIVCLHKIIRTCSTSGVFNSTTGKKDGFVSTAVATYNAKPWVTLLTYHYTIASYQQQEDLLFEKAGLLCAFFQVDIANHTQACQLKISSMQLTNYYTPSLVPRAWVRGYYTPQKLHLTSPLLNYFNNANRDLMPHIQNSAAAM